MRANGVSLVANDTMRELEIMMPTGLAMPAVRGRTSTETTATIIANRNPESSSIHSSAPHRDAMEDTSTPSSTLQAMRKNAQLPAVA